MTPDDVRLNDEIVARPSSGCPLLYIYPAGTHRAPNPPPPPFRSRDRETTYLNGSLGLFGPKLSPHKGCCFSANGRLASVEFPGVADARAQFAGQAYRKFAYFNRTADGYSSDVGAVGRRTEQNM